MIRTQPTQQAAMAAPLLKTRQSGLTMVELLVAMGISTLIAIAAMSALVISRQGFATVDSASQLRDNARFASDLIQRLGVQAGYKDIAYSATNRYAKDAQDPAPDITGFNNSLASSTDPENTATARTAGSVGYGSDILILRYQPSETFPGSGVSDKSMIDCTGNAADFIPTDRDDRAVSVLHVQVSTVTNEPTLMCSTKSRSSGTWSTQPIISGVENFQVLYGVDSSGADSVADVYWRADQMGTPGSAAANTNWRKVRSIRIGMVIRGAIGSLQDPSTQVFYPLGMGKESNSGTSGFAMSTLDTGTSIDVGTRFTPARDTRIRQVVTFTIHLRNEQGL